MNRSATARALAPPRADTRQNLLDSTRQCIREHGLAGATSRRITQAAGANLAAITYHFGSKHELIAEALFSDLERRVRPALDLFGGATDPTETLLRAVAHLTHEFERSRGDTLLYLETIFLATRDPKVAKSALGLYRRLRRELATLISELIDDGVIPAWLEPEAAASLILAVANGIALQTCFDPSGSDHTAMAGQFAGILLATATSTE